MLVHLRERSAPCDKRAVQQFLSECVFVSAGKRSKQPRSPRCGLIVGETSKGPYDKGGSGQQAMGLVGLFCSEVAQPHTVSGTRLVRSQVRSDVGVVWVWGRSSWTYVGKQKISGVLLPPFCTCRECYYEVLVVGGAGSSAAHARKRGRAGGRSAAAPLDASRPAAAFHEEIQAFITKLHGEKGADGEQLETKYTVKQTGVAIPKLATEAQHNFRRHMQSVTPRQNVVQDPC